MPRTGRAVTPNYPHPVVQPGHNRQLVFAARSIKCTFGFTKDRYRAPMKNNGALVMVFSLASVARLHQMLR